MLAFPKNPSVRDEKFRRFIASQPCLKCKIEGHTQAAHLERGGKGYKGHDSTCAPLCCVSGNSCHVKLDQHLEIRYWRENLQRAIENQRKVYTLWKRGDIGEAESLMRDF